MSRRGHNLMLGALPTLDALCDTIGLSRSAVVELLIHWAATRADNSRSIDLAPTAEAGTRVNVSLSVRAIERLRGLEQVCGLEQSAIVDALIHEGAKVWLQATAPAAQLAS